MFEKKEMDLQILPAFNRPDTVRVLFSEYTRMLAAGDPSIQQYLAIQHYDEELNHLEAKYGLPDGRLYLAYCGGEPAGCIGLRKIDSRNCEMKRLVCQAFDSAEKRSDSGWWNRS